jgi:hypothetical protein
MLNNKHNDFTRILLESLGDKWWSPVLGDSLFSDPSKTTLELLADQGLFPDAENTRSVKDRYKFLCPLPGHGGDSNPSFWVHSDGIRWKCFPCGEGGGPARLVQLLGRGPIPRMPKAQQPLKPKTVKKEKEHPSGCTLAQLAEGKCLPVVLLREMGWYDCDYYGIPAVAMPYANSTQIRVAVSGKGARFKWLTGGNSHNAKEMYVVEPERPIPGNRTVLVAEGTTDCAAARHMGLRMPVRGLPGTGTWSEKTGTAQRWAKELSAWDVVVVWQEPGDAGQKLVKAMARLIPDLRVINAEITGVKDPCELLAQVGEDIEGARDWLEGLIEEAEPYLPAPEEEDVLFRVVRGFGIYSKKDKTFSAASNPWKPRKRDNTRPSALWDFCCETFPDPPGVEPKVKSHILYSAVEGQALVCDLRSPTWLNPANAAFKKRKFLFHGTRKLSAFDALYVKNVAVDDWSEQSHEAVTKAIERAGGQYLAFDNQLSRGCWRYLSTVPLDDFDPLGDLSGWLVSVLNGIRVPDSIPKGRRFRPIRGTQALTKGCDAPVDEDRGKYEVVAVSEEKTDWNLLEAELRAAGRVYEQVDPVYRAQHRWGIRFAANSLEEVQEFALGFGGVYQLRRRGKKSAEEQLAVEVGL